MNYVAADMMSVHGGRFARNISDAWYSGNDSSRAILEGAFPELFAQYERMAQPVTSSRPELTIEFADGSRHTVTVPE